MKAKPISIVRGAVGLGLLGLLAGCANGPSWGAWSKRPTDAQVAAVLARVDAEQQVAQQAEPATPTRPVLTMSLASTDR